MDQTPEPRVRIKTIVVFALLVIVFGAVIAFGYFATFSRPVTTVILIRHAEKKIEPDNPDPDLSPEGQTRAQEIARIFADSGIQTIYATQYKRTQQTVGPLANRLGISITEIDAKQPAEVVKCITTKNRGQTVFVAGHNNTIPEIVNMLSGEKFGNIPESEFDNLYIVTIYRFGKAKVVRLKYGAASSQGVGTGTMIK